METIVTPEGEFNFISDCHITKWNNGFYNVYHDESIYGNSPIPKIRLGKKEIDASGNAVKFATVQDADNWVKGGKVIYPKVQFGI